MAESVVTDAQSLQELFKEGWEAQKRVNDLSSTSDEHKACVMRGIKCLEQATHIANQLSLFSGNEEVEDVPTTNLKFFLLPALLGDLTLQLPDENRLDTIRKARIYFVDYLQRCKSYSITTEDPLLEQDNIPSASGSAPPTRKTYEQLTAERTAKITRFRNQKELERKLKELTVKVDLSLVSSQHPVEDELVREQAITLLQVWVFRCQDHIHSINQETDLLEAMEKKGGNGGLEATPPDPPPPIKPVKPIVITRDMLQSKVFGAGYPSLPTMSVEEFYQQRYKEEVEQRQSEAIEASMLESRVTDDTMVGGGRGRRSLETEEMEEEEEESEETLKKARDWDEFKDDNRTGWGNKKNMG